MSVEKYACRKCQAVFDVVSPYDLVNGEKSKCPKCGSIDVEKVPSWIPNGFNVNLYFAQSAWKYLCHQCQATFELAVPSGPTEEKQRKCPTCGSQNIERLTVLIVEPPVYCS
jgi:putative FmdB family regulatory protein